MPPKSPKGRPSSKWKPGESGNPLTQFKPGNPGGPGRSKKVRAIEEELVAKYGDNVGLILEFLLDGALAGWINVPQIMACEKVMDRIIGKARVRAEITGEEGGPLKIKASDALVEKADRIIKAALLLSEGATAKVE